MDKILGGLFAIGGILLGVVLLCGLLGLFEAYVLQDIGILYDIPIIKSLTFMQIFGLTIWIDIVTFKLGDKKYGENKYSVFETFLLKIVGILFVWGVAYLMLILIK
jgi:hypothetical protein